MRVGKMSVIEMKRNKVGIQFEGLIEDKVYILKFYSMNINHKQIMENLARYKYIDMDYYPKTKVIKEYHPHLGED
jgi:hypothetical protein